MGFHVCEYCRAEGKHLVTSSGDVKMVFRKLTGGMVGYVVPDMISHYIEDHQYLPPDSFVLAIMMGYPLLWGSRRQTRGPVPAEYARVEFIEVGYLRGLFRKGTVTGFAAKLREVIRQASEWENK